MKLFFTILFVLLNGCVYSQNESVTTVSSIIFNQKVDLNQKDKRTHSSTIDLITPEDLVKQFERIDAVYLTYWTGSGQIARDHYEKDCSKVNRKPDLDLDPIIFYAQNNPGLFTYPNSQTGFGTEISLFEYNTDSVVLARYKKKKIEPKGIFPNLLMRHVGTTAVNFTYRFPLPKKQYLDKKNPTYKLLLRTSSKSDTVNLDVKVVLTIQGKRFQMSNAPEMGKFVFDAIFEGLNEDAFPLNHAKWITENRTIFFVNKCPICTNVEAALSKYIANAKNSDTKISSELLEKIAKGTRNEKQIALAQIVNRYTERHFEKLNLNEREKSKLKSDLESARNAGMKIKKDDFGDFCPSCDGACSKLKK